MCTQGSFYLRILPIQKGMKKKKSSLGCIFWVALILLVLIVFFFNRSTINSVLESTGFLDFITQKDEKETKVVRIGEETEDGGESASDKDSKDTTDKGKEDGSSENDGEKDGPKIVLDVMEEKEETPVSREEPVEEEQAKEEGQKIRKGKLFFIDVGPEGEINLKGVERSIHYIDSPLTATIRTLLKGLLPSELNKELMTLIPEGSELLSAEVSEGTAFLNFNEAFRFNTLGAEGTLAQLKQIVYTATEFSTVQRVQILIEGKRSEVLNQEGVYIGVPITRSSFQ